MKMNNLKTGKAILSIVLALLTTGIQAQRGYGMHPGHGVMADSAIHSHAIPNLTIEQEKMISTLRTTHQKEMTNYRNDLAIKQAELQKYLSADKPDMNLINKTIDETGRLTTEMQKKRIANQLDIRNLLTDEQKAAFDNKQVNRGYGAGRGRGTWEFDGRQNGSGMNHGGHGNLYPGK
jgi:Spy/CpxP family protein refolding chaperone